MTATTAKPAATVNSVRLAPDNTTILEELGLLEGLAGSWHGRGFNLIARPDFHDQANLYLQLNQTRESLHVEPIGASIPNRGFGQDDIELFGLTYLQKISDAATGGAMHIEPGMWITQPATNYPSTTPPFGSQLVARLGTIPHGNSLLAQGTATPFTGPPVLAAPGGAGPEYAFSQFPSFNTTPFATSPTVPSPVINAAGSSEQLTAPGGGFTQYNLAIAESAQNPRTPFGTDPADPALPVAINGVPTQDVVNDPIELLRTVIEHQVSDGHTFDGVALNVATESSIEFFSDKNSKAGAATVTVQPANGAGGIENLLFLDGEAGPLQGPNAQTALVYSTFWLERVSHPTRRPFMQLQYAQMVVLNFHILSAPQVNLGWPHVSVATLRKTI